MSTSFNKQTFNSSNDNNNNNDSHNNSIANLQGNALVGNTINYIRRYERRYQSDDFDSRHVLYTRKGCLEAYTDQLVFCVKEDPRNEFMNPHHDAANLRKFYEHKNLVQFANFDRVNGGNLRKVIDVGASARLVNEPAITQIVALNPHCGTGDYLREAKYIGRDQPATVVKKTLGEFLDYIYECNSEEEGRKAEGSLQYLYNFTDSFYYVQNDLAKLASSVGYGVFACGACHVPKLEEQTDGLLKIGDHIFGYVKRIGSNRMQMKVQGNPEFYEHDIVLEKALEFDSFCIRASDHYALLCHVLDRFDFGATEYTRFCLIKITLKEYEKYVESPRMVRAHKDFIPLNVEDVIVKEVNKKKKLVELVPQTSENIKAGTVTRVGGDTVAFKAVKDKIVGVKVVNVVKQRANVIEQVKNWKKDIAAQFANVQLGAIDSDFELPMATYNKVVKELAKAERIDRKVIKSALFVAQINLPNADMNQYLVPVVASALRDAFGLEVRITEMLDSKTSQLLQRVKAGEDIKAKDTIFNRLARWVLGSEDESLDF